MIEIYAAFLEIEDALSDLDELIKPIEEKGDLSKGVKQSLDYAILQFLVDYGRIPELQLSDSTKDILDDALVERFKKELAEAKSIFPSSPNLKIDKDD